MSTPISPAPGYIDDLRIKRGVLALKKYLKLRGSKEENKKKTKDLLQDDVSSPVYIDVVFKNIPSNSKTYIHNIVLPHHWRLEQEPEKCDLALFVSHRKPETEAQKIQFSRDRDLDMENTHSYYKDLLQEKLDGTTYSRITRIISSKELATEYNTHKKIDELSKTYDIFLSDKKLMANKFNALPRRLGRRFWVREKKVPIIINLEAKELKHRFQKALSTESFYVIGRSSTERIQVGLIEQKTNKIVRNIETFLETLYNLYGDNVRFLKLRGCEGFSLPIYADLSVVCRKNIKMNKERVKTKPIVSDFDLLPDNLGVKVHASGAVKVIRNNKRAIGSSES